MKIQVTHVVDDTMRFGIAVRETGELRIATREECVKFLTEAVEDELAEVAEVVERIKKQIHKEA